MDQTIYATPSKTQFAKGVANAKLYGGKFDPQSKTWAIPFSKYEKFGTAFGTVEEFLRAKYLAPAANKPQSWNPSAMDAENSIY